MKENLYFTKFYDNTVKLFNCVIKEKNIKIYKDKNMLISMICCFYDNDMVQVLDIIKSQIVFVTTDNDSNIFNIPYKKIYKKKNLQAKDTENLIKFSNQLSLHFIEFHASLADLMRSLSVDEKNIDNIDLEILQKNINFEFEGDINLYINMSYIDIIKTFTNTNPLESIIAQDIIPYEIKTKYNNITNYFKENNKNTEFADKIEDIIDKDELYFLFVQCLLILYYFNVAIQKTAYFTLETSKTM